MSCSLSSTVGIEQHVANDPKTNWLLRSDSKWGEGVEFKEGQV